MLRIGTVSAQPRSSPLWMAFERRMAELGYAQGENFALEIERSSLTDVCERPANGNLSIRFAMTLVLLL